MILRKINTEEEYKSIIKDGNRIVKFSANWCSPCRLLSDRIQNLDENAIGDVHFYEVDVDEEAFDNVCMELNILSIPVLVFFKDGAQVDKTVGLLTEEQLKNKITELYK